LHRRILRNPVVGSIAVTRPPAPCFCHSSRSCARLSARSAFFMATTETASNDLPSGAFVPRTRMRSPGCKSCNCRAAAFFRSFSPGSIRNKRAPSSTTTLISFPPSAARVMLFPEAAFTVPTAFAVAAAASCPRSEGTPDKSQGQAIATKTRERIRENIRECECFHGLCVLVLIYSTTP
jgi:hypothetical protein